MAFAHIPVPSTCTSFNKLLNHTNNRQQLPIILQQFFTDFHDVGQGRHVSPPAVPLERQNWHRDRMERERGVIYEELQCGGRSAQGLMFLEGVSAGLMFPSGVLVFRGYQGCCSFGSRRAEWALSSGRNEKQLRSRSVMEP